MIKNYKFANKIIRINTDFDFESDEYSKIFETESSIYDKEIIINLGDTQVNGKPIYICDDYEEYVINNSIVRTYYEDKSDIPHFILNIDNENYSGILNIDSNEFGKSTKFFWGLTDLPSVELGLDRVVIHASFISYKGKAILFCGKSGIGKSTQADLWNKYENADIINGDKCIVYSENGKVFASSLPVCGTSRICKNAINEVIAIVFLSQGKNNIVSEMSLSASLSSLLANSLYNRRYKNEAAKASQILTETVLNSHIFRFECTPDENAVNELKKALNI